jgi:ribosome biogenesis GTPase A
MTIQWYPGQMAKARLYLKKMLKLIDLVVEIRDARIPESSQNPEIDKLVGNRARLVILNKQDLADQELTALWLASLKKKNVEAISISTLQGQGMSKVLSFVRKFGQEQRLRNRRGKPLRIMVVGIPNVGKSTLINRLSGRGSARTGNRPGITKGEQWVRVAEGIELLDTIGLLWPKFDSPEVAFKLAVTGAIKYELLDDYALAVKLLEYMVAKVPERLQERYKFTPGEDARGEDLLLDIGRSRGAIKPGGEPDPERAAEILLVDFRLGRLGEFTLDVPPLT